MEIQAWRHASTNSLSQLTPQWCKGAKRVPHSHCLFSPPGSSTDISSLMWQWVWHPSLDVDGKMAVEWPTPGGVIIPYVGDLESCTHRCAMFSGRRSKTGTCDVKTESCLLRGTLACLPEPECVFITHFFVLVAVANGRFDSMQNERGSEKALERAFAKERRVWCL